MVCGGPLVDAALGFGPSSYPFSGDDAFGVDVEVRDGGLFDHLVLPSSILNAEGIFARIGGVMGVVWT